MKHRKQLLPLAAALGIALAVMSCSSVPDASALPPEMSAIELSQKGQEALDRNKYAAARVYYQTIIDRYGTDNSLLTGAEFEIAHIFVKQKKWDEARPMLEAIIARYESAGGAALPPEYLVLARNDLAKIPLDQ